MNSVYPTGHKKIRSNLLFAKGLPYVLDVVKPAETGRPAHESKGSADMVCRTYKVAHIPLAAGVSGNPLPRPTAEQPSD